MLTVRCDLCNKKLSGRPDKYKTFNLTKEVDTGLDQDIPVTITLEMRPVSRAGKLSFEHVCKACGRKEAKRAVTRLQDS